MFVTLSRGSEGAGMGGTGQVIHATDTGLIRLFNERGDEIPVSWPSAYACDRTGMLSEWHGGQNPFVRRAVSETLKEIAEAEGTTE